MWEKSQRQSYGIPESGRDPSSGFELLESVNQVMTPFCPPNGFRIGLNYVRNTRTSSLCLNSPTDQSEPKFSADIIAFVFLLRMPTSFWGKVWHRLRWQWWPLESLARPSSCIPILTHRRHNTLAWHLPRPVDECQQAAAPPAPPQWQRPVSGPIHIVHSVLLRTTGLSEQLLRHQATNPLQRLQSLQARLLRWRI